MMSMSYVVGLLFNHRVWRCGYCTVGIAVLISCVFVPDCEAQKVQGKLFDLASHFLG